MDVCMYLCVYVYTMRIGFSNKQLSSKICQPWDVRVGCMHAKAQRLDVHECLHMTMMDLIWSNRYPLKQPSAPRAQHSFRTSASSEAWRAMANAGSNSPVQAYMAGLLSPSHPLPHSWSVLIKGMDDRSQWLKPLLQDWRENLPEAKHATRLEQFDAKESIKHNYKIHPRKWSNHLGWQGSRMFIARPYKDFGLSQPWASFLWTPSAAGWFVGGRKIMSHAPQRIWIQCSERVHMLKTLGTFLWCQPQLA